MLSIKSGGVDLSLLYTYGLGSRIPDVPPIFKKSTYFTLLTSRVMYYLLRILVFCLNLLFVLNIGRISGSADSDYAYIKHKTSKSGQILTGLSFLLLALKA